MQAPRRRNSAATAGEHDNDAGHEHDDAALHHGLL
jgi:hypothetical protein